MTTRMVSPKHGVTIAYNTNDIAYLEKLGWSVEVPAVIGNFSAHAKAENGTPVPEAVQFYEAPARQKPGPKPKAK